MSRLKVINCFAILYLGTVGLLWGIGSIAMLWFFLGVVCWIALLAWGSFDIRLNVFVNAVSSNAQVKNRQIALTFDDGPTPFTLKVLDLLQQYNAKATFFCIGTQVEKHPLILQQILAQGHSVGNHTYTHTTKMGFLPANAVLQEIQLAERAIVAHSGFTPTLYRPPFGVTNPNIAKALNQTSYKVIGWNIRSLDTVIAKEDVIFERVKKKVKPGAIILFHDTSDKSIAALTMLLEYLSTTQYESVTIDELLKLK